MNNSHILIVDDTQRSREILEGVLTQQGYTLTFADNGPEALKLAADLHPDLIMLDVMMPGMDGFEVCRRLRADPILCEVPVVMVTALDDQESRLKGFEAGADEFISKPYNLTELRARVRTITRLNRYRSLLEERSNLEVAHRALKQAYDATIEGWARALELRDRETEGHSQRVTALTLHLAREMGCSEDEMVHMRRGALLHDIGKMAVPDKILNKPGPLSDEEWEIMHKHTLHAEELLSSVEFLRPAMDIPSCHHEKWDGTGYPRGLKGEDIPLAARIFAVVDVWDALRSDRPYRQAIPEDESLQIIREQSGSHFDSRVVEAFFRVVPPDK